MIPNQAASGKKGIWRIELPEEESALLESLCNEFGLSASTIFREWLRGVKYDDSQSIRLSLDMYQELALRTISPKAAKKPLEHAALKLSGEIGELCDYLAKCEFHGHQWSNDIAAIEAGDILWHLAELAWALKLPLSEIGRRNIEKLRERYPDGFDEERSRNSGSQTD